jgi:drug/metabolite transporter (DMT)-like permease
MAALLAWGFLHEPLSLLQGIGGTVVLAGIAIASQSRLQAEKQVALKIET